MMRLTEFFNALMHLVGRGLDKDDVYFDLTFCMADDPRCFDNLLIVVLRVLNINDALLLGLF